MKIRKFKLGLLFAFFIVIGLTLQTGNYNPVDTMVENLPNLEKDTVTAGIAVTSNGAFTGAGFTGAGTEGNPYVLDGETVTTTFGVYGILIQGTTAHFVIQNCTVDLSSVSSEYGIGLESIENGTIVNCEVSGTKTGIYARESEDVNITANTVYNCSTNGIYPYLTPGVLIHNNTITDIQNVGIYGADCPNATITSNTIMRLNLDGAQGNSYGINFAGDNLTIKDNELRTLIKGFGINVQDSANTVIENNLVWQARFGIAGWNAPSITIANNNVSCLEHRGIIVGGASSYSHVIGNRVYHGSEPNCIGIQFRNSASLGVIEFNNISNFWYGIYFEANAGNNTIADNNIGWSDLYNGYDDRSTSPKNNWTSNQFSDYVSGNYTIHGAAGVNDTSAAIIVDGVTPTIDSPADIVINDTDTDKWISWAPQDSYPNVYTLHRNGSPVETDQNWCSTTISFSLDDLPAAVYYFTLYVYDFEWSSTNDFVYVTVLDTQSPVFISATGNYTIEYGERVWTNFTATDDTPDIKIAWSDGAGPYWNNAWISGFNILWDHVFPSVGDHNYTIVLTDKAGNSAKRTCFVTVEDTTAPTAPDFPTDFGAETGEDAWVNFTLYDPYYDSYEIWLDDVMDVSTTFADGQYITYMLNFATPGEHNVTLVAWDDDVNILKETCIVTYVDSTGPDITGPDDFSYEAGESPTTSWSWTELNPENYTIYENNTQATFSTSFSGDIQHTLDGLTPGLWNITLIIYDETGNFETDELWVTIEDTTAPLLSGDDDLEITMGPTITLNWTCSDLYPASYVLLRNGIITLDHLNWYGDDISYQVSLAAGVYNFTLTVFDGSGNSASDTVIITVNEETTTTTPTTETTTTTTTTPTTTTTTTPPPDDGGLMMILVVAGVGGAIVVVIVVLYLKSKKS